MKRRYARSFTDFVYVVAEANDNKGYLQGLYITESGLIIVAHDVVLDGNDIDHWGRGDYGAHKNYSTTEAWLNSLEHAIKHFKEIIER